MTAVMNVCATMDNGDVRVKCVRRPFAAKMWSANPSLTAVIAPGRVATHLSLVSTVREHVVLTSWVIHLCAAVRMGNVLALRWAVILANFDQRMTGVANVFVRQANGFVQPKDAHKSAKRASNVCLTLTHVAVSGVVTNPTVCPWMT